MVRSGTYFLCHHLFRVNSFYLFPSFCLAWPWRQQLWPLNNHQLLLLSVWTWKMKDEPQLSVLVQLLQYQPQTDRNTCSTPGDITPVICTPAYLSNNRWRRNAKQKEIVLEWRLDNLKEVTHKKHQNKNEEFDFIPVQSRSRFVNNKVASAFMGSSTVNHIFAVPRSNGSSAKIHQLKGLYQADLSVFLIKF